MEGIRKDIRDGSFNTNRRLLKNQAAERVIIHQSYDFFRIVISLDVFNQVYLGFVGSDNNGKLQFIRWMRFPICQTCNRCFEIINAEVVKFVT